MLDQRRISRVAVPVLLAVAALEATLLFRMTADDAFIVFRYARNLVEHGQPVFNLGERVNAVTSPLLVYIDAALYRLVGDLELGSKLFALLLFALLCAAAALWFRKRGLALALFLALVAASPYFALWTVGGLETPHLALLIYLMAQLYLAQAERPRPWRLVLLVVLAGIAFVVRYDSIVFAAPLALFALRSLGLPRALWALATAALLPIGWLAFSWHYYGDILPTSFYLKPPTIDPFKLFHNAIYVLEFLLFSSVILVGWTVAWGGAPRAVGRGARRKRALLVAFGLTLAYATTVATAHMMFSYRMLVAYLPALALVLVDRLAKDSETPGWPSKVAALVVITTVLNLANLAVVRFQSIAGSRVGEYALTNVEQYETFLEVMRGAARSIDAHWRSRPESAARPPRLDLFAEGVIPYLLPTSRSYGSLTSYRSRCAYDPLSSDYLLLRLLPYPIRTATGARMVELREANERLIADHPVIFRQTTKFEGLEQSWVVLWNEHPRDNRLPNRVHDACL